MMDLVESFPNDNDHIHPFIGLPNLAFRCKFGWLPCLVSAICCFLGSVTDKGTKSLLTAIDDDIITPALRWEARMENENPSDEDINYPRPRSIAESILGEDARYERSM